jgi:hypothetical protein
VTDASGNIGSDSFTVTVVDTTDPVVTCGADIQEEATSPDGAEVFWEAAQCTASDIADAGVIDCTEDIPSGSTFPLGPTTVECSVTDDSGNTGSDSFTVTVVDTTDPVVTCGADIQEEATGPSGAVVTWGDGQCTASDLVDLGVTDCTEDPASGSTFPLGPTTVECSVTDASGNTGTGTFVVTVVFGFDGFFQPIDNDKLNSVKAGSGIPVKFSLGGNMGLDIFFDDKAPWSVKISCDSYDDYGEDPIETVTSGGSGLSYDVAADQYIYVWKTEKSWAGTCRQLVVKLADGSLHAANFKFK